jgi:hypothetical protein
MKDIPWTQQDDGWTRFIGPYMLSAGDNGDGTWESVVLFRSTIIISETKNDADEAKSRAECCLRDMCLDVSECLRTSVKATADQQGLDKDQDYVAVDNPFWDCTDAAHPAWWRGEQYASKHIIKDLQKIVIGPESTEEMPYQTLRHWIKTAMETSNDIIIEDALEALEGLWTEEDFNEIPPALNLMLMGMDEIATLPKTDES